jgi:hypothetical protein
VDEPPAGYIKPFWVYLVEFTEESEDVCLGQAGAFTSEEEAVRLRQLLESEGRGPFRLNMVPVHARVADWGYDR